MEAHACFMRSNCIVDSWVLLPISFHSVNKQKASNVPGVSKWEGTRNQFSLYVMSNNQRSAGRGSQSHSHFRNIWTPSTDFACPVSQLFSSPWIKAWSCCSFFFYPFSIPQVQVWQWTQYIWHHRHQVEYSNLSKLLWSQLWQNVWQKSSWWTMMESESERYEPNYIPTRPNSRQVSARITVALSLCLKISAPSSSL